MRFHAPPLRLIPIVALLACAALLCRARPALGATELRIATLAPKNSSWGKTYQVWQEVVDKKTNGQVKLNIYYNAVQGDESAMVSKMKAGQIDGAALTAMGLSRIYRDVLILQLPGVVNSWPLLDLVRALMLPGIEKGFEDAGFRILGWGDVGLVRQMSHGFPVRNPKDLQGRHPLVWRDEPMGPMLYSLMGGCVPVPLGVPEVLPALRTGHVDAVAAPALAAEQLQWTPYLDYIGENVVVTAIGAAVLRRAAYDSIPADLKDLFFRLQQKALHINRDRIRKLDAESYLRLSSKMTIVRQTDEDRVAWYRVFLQAVRKLRQGTFPRPLVDRILEITGKG